MKRVVLTALTLGVFLGSTGLALAADDNDQTALEQRVIESRRFDGLPEKDLLSASVNVLQDMGYNIDNADSALGVITASKTWAPEDPLGLRDGKSWLSIPSIGPLALLSAAFEGHRLYVKTLKEDYRVSLVVKPASPDSSMTVFSETIKNEEGSKKLKKTEPKEKKKKPAEPTSFIVRVIFQKSTRIDDDKQIGVASRIDAQTIKDPALYQEFYDKLSKSVFIEAQQL